MSTTSDPSTIVPTRRRSTNPPTKNTSPPRAVTTARNEIHRTIADTVSTPVAPERPARTPPINSPTSTSLAPTDPTVNVNAPCTTWPSLDTTRHATTWTPSAKGGNPESTTVVGDSPDPTEPPRIAAPDASKSEMASAAGDTGSVNSSRMTSGEDSRTADGDGSEDSRDAWAETGDGEPTSATTTASTIVASATTSRDRMDRCTFMTTVRPVVRRPRPADRATRPDVPGADASRSGPGDR